MKITIDERVLSNARPHITWIEPGEYDVVRFFSPTKVIIDVTQATSTQRQITIVTLGGDIALHDEKNKNTISSEA